LDLGGRGLRGWRWRRVDWDFWLAERRFFGRGGGGQFGILTISAYLLGG
jgi:hypothetical protein